MKLSPLRTPKPLATLALTALAALTTLALLAQVPTAGAHAPPLGPTFTFPPDMPQAGVSALCHEFHNRRKYISAKKIDVEA